MNEQINKLSTDQKRKYLHLLQTEGTQAANEFLQDAIRPGIMVFDSSDERAAFFATKPKYEWPKVSISLQR